MSKFSFLFLLFLGISACKTETVESFGRQTATKIQAENQTPKAEVARVYVGNVTTDYGSFRFEDEFIIVDSTRYNLNRLLSYRIYLSSGTRTLELRF